MTVQDHAPGSPFHSQDLKTGQLTLYVRNMEAVGAVILRTERIKTGWRVTWYSSRHEFFER